MGEDAAQLSELPVHAGAGFHAADLDQGQPPQRGGPEVGPRVAACRQGSSAAGRFNAGQKLIFWSVILIGGAIAVTGYLLMFPFTVTDDCRMQLAHIVHGIGGSGDDRRHHRPYLYRHGRHGGRLRGDGHWRGRLNWAKEHHSLWAEQELAKGSQHPAPAE